MRGRSEGHIMFVICYFPISIVSFIIVVGSHGPVGKVLDSKLKV